MNEMGLWNLSGYPWYKGMGPFKIIVCEKGDEKE